MTDDVAVQERLAWLEHRLAELEDTVNEAHARIGALEVELARVKEATEARSDDAAGEGWEPPPHY